MADNVAITAGSGTTISTDDIAGVQVQRVKIQWGADGTANDTNAVTPLPINLGTNTLANGQAAPTNSAATLVAARTGRTRLVLLNMGSVRVYVGIATVTAANGFPLDPGASVTLNTAALVQGITSAGTGAIAYIEEYPA